MRFLPHLLLCATIISLLSPSSAFGWGKPHIVITRAALEVLPPWQKDLLGEESTKLGDSYCLIPDHVFNDKENAKFAQMDTQPGELYILNLHLPAQQAENLETLHYFMVKAVQSLRDSKTSDAARYMGTICHLLEDYGSPSHTLPGDNMFTLLQQFLPPSKAMQGKLLHSPIESGDFTVSIQGYQPKLLGTTINEASWRLMHRVHEGIINARSTTIPIIQALYAEDNDAVVKAQTKAAALDARIVADALYTILCLGVQKFENAEQDELKQVAIDSFFPLEAESLYYPQSQFFSAPNWGYPHSGVILAGGNKAVPLKLKVKSADGVIIQKFTRGISAGMGKSLTFMLPKDVYSNFKVRAGLHPELGTKGRIEFTISSDNKTLSTLTISGTEPSRIMECDLNGVTKLKLTLTSRSPNSKNNYAIWAEPVLIKK